MALASSSLQNGFIPTTSTGQSCSADRRFSRRAARCSAFCEATLNRITRRWRPVSCPWTYPGIKAEFLQFLTVQTHVLDYALWPNSPSLDALHNLVWLAVLTFMVGLFYRRILGPTWVAGLATLLFAVEDAHALPAGWICNRNVLLAATFGMACVLAHDSWARRRKLPWYLLALVLWTASLCSKEAGIATSAFVFAYVVWLQEDSWGRKFLTLVPYGAVLVVWRIIRDSLGYGVHGIGLYVDPLGDPSGFAASMVNWAPAFLAGQWALPPADVFAFLPPPVAVPVWWWTVILLALLALLFWPLLRTDRVARAFTCAMLLAVIPICAGYPDQSPADVHGHCRLWIDGPVRRIRLLRREIRPTRHDLQPRGEVRGGRLAGFASRIGTAWLVVCSGQYRSGRRRQWGRSICRRNCPTKS